MKTLIAVLSIVVAVLALALWKRDASARNSLATADAALAALSNQLAEASMKVTHQEQIATAARAGLDDRARELAAMSNTVAQLTSDLGKSRAETVAARARAQDFEARLAASDAQTASLKRRFEGLDVEIQSLKAEVAQTRSNATELQSARFDLANEVECLKIEKSELARQWNDSRALRLQLRLLKSHTPFIALEPDDSVRLLSVPK